jgi:hypothetical protein
MFCIRWLYEVFLNGERMDEGHKKSFYNKDKEMQFGLLSSCDVECTVLRNDTRSEMTWFAMVKTMLEFRPNCLNLKPVCR